MGEPTERNLKSLLLLGSVFRHRETPHPGASGHSWAGIPTFVKNSENGYRLWEDRTDILSSLRTVEFDEHNYAQLKRYDTLPVPIRLNFKTYRQSQKKLACSAFLAARRAPSDIPCGNSRNFVENKFRWMIFCRVLTGYLSYPMFETDLKSD